MSLEINIQAIVFKTIVHVIPNTILAVQKSTLSTTSYPYDFKTKIMLWLSVFMTVRMFENILREQF